MAEAIRDVGQRWFTEVWNNKRREAIAEMLAPDGVICDGGETMVGPAGFYPFYERIRAAFPDLHVTVEDTIVEGDKLVVRWSSTATHTGAGLGVPASGKKCTVTGITIARIKDGQLVEGWQNWDMLGLMQQIQGGPRAKTYINAE